MPVVVFASRQRLTTTNGDAAGVVVIEHLNARATLALHRNAPMPAWHLRRRLFPAWRREHGCAVPLYVRKRLQRRATCAHTSSNSRVGPRPRATPRHARDDDAVAGSFDRARRAELFSCPFPSSEKARTIEGREC